MFNSQHDYVEDFIKTTGIENLKNNLYIIDGNTYKLQNEGDIQRLWNKYIISQGQAELAKAHIMKYIYKYVSGLAPVSNTDDCIADYDYILRTPSNDWDIRSMTILQKDRRAILRSTNYDPIEGETPLFDKLINCWNLSPVYKEYLLDFLADILVGRNREQLLVLLGEGKQGTGSGKSTLLGILQGILGEYSYKLPASYITDNTNGTNTNEAMANISRLTVVDETDCRKLLARDFVKSMTQLDATVHVRELYKGAYIRPIKTHLIIATNHMPQGISTDPALCRRVVVIPCQVSNPDEEIASIAYNTDKTTVQYILETEGSAIFYKLMLRCAQNKGIPVKPPTSAEQAARQLDAKLIGIDDWVEQYFEVTNNKNDKLYRDELYIKYRSHCKDTGQRPIDINEFALSFRQSINTMFEVDIKITNISGNKKGWRGIKFSPIN